MSAPSLVRLPQVDEILGGKEDLIDEILRFASEDNPCAIVPLWCRLNKERCDDAFYHRYLSPDERESKPEGLSWAEHYVQL